MTAADAATLSCTEFVEQVVDVLGPAAPEHLHASLGYLFDGACLSGARVLDVGGGTGCTHFMPLRKAPKKSCALNQSATGHHRGCRLNSIG